MIGFLLGSSQNISKVNSSTSKSQFEVEFCSISIYKESAYEAKDGKLNKATKRYSRSISVDLTVSILTMENTLLLF